MEARTDKVWSTQDIVDNASSWTLAGDAALLKHLESFSENLFAKATETNEKLNGLLDNLNAASIKLDLVKNEFLSLQNTQFIESRVYEDDETVEKVQETVETKKNDEETRKLALKNAVLAGLEIMHKSYDKVRVPASDSEDEDGDGGSFVLSMKDPYMSRPLPYVIGTEDWYKDTHVGLEESESDSEPEREKEEVYSDSDSESNLPVTDRRGVSTSDSGTDISNRIERPVANSTLNDTMASTDSEDYNNSVPAKAPISNVSFAEQLAARLGNVAVQSKEEEPVPKPEPEINRRPLQKAPPMPARVLADLDEPPPLDDFDDGLFANKSKQDMFSGGDGLFDESGDESNSFWGTKRIEDKRNSFSSKSAEQTEKEDKSKITRGLFDDEESDEDMFATAAATQPLQKSILMPFSSNTISFVDDEPPEIPDGSKNKSAAFNPDNKLLINAEQRPPKKISLFDDADFKSDPFSEGGLFGSGNGLFAGIGGRSAGGGLFDDEDSLFASVRKTATNKDGGNTKKKSSFLDEEDEESHIPKSSSSFLGEKNEDRPISKTRSSFLDEKNEVAPISKNRSSFLDEENEDRPIPKNRSSFFDKKKNEDGVNAKKKSFLDENEESEDDAQKGFAKKPYFTEESDEEEERLPISSEEGFTKKPLIAKENEEEEKGSVKKLFNDEGDVITNVKKPLFSRENEEAVKEALFTEEGFVKKSLFNEETLKKPLFTEEDVKKSSSSRGKNESTKNEGKDVVDKDTRNKEESRLFSEDEDLFSSKRNEKKPAGLFEDNEDIFADNKTKGTTSNSEDFVKTSEGNKTKTLFSEDVFTPTNTSLFDDDGLSEKPPKESVPRFVDSTPPPDDDWETKSDNLFEDSDDIFEEVPVLSTQRSNPFDEEPPTLEPELNKQKSLFEDDGDIRSEVKVANDDSNGESEVREVKKLFEDDDNLKSEVKNVFEDNLKSEVKEVKKPEIKVKPSLSKPKAKDDVKLNEDQNKQNVKEESPKKALPGKLKHNLNINVSALMPGAALPRKKELTSPLSKSQSLEEAGSKSEEAEGGVGVVHTQSYMDVRAPDEDDDDDGHIKPLHSYTKNRAKVPMKRKPSTRRGRQESMRKHVVGSPNALNPEDSTANNNYLQSGGEGEGEQLNNNVSSTGKTGDVCNLQFAKSKDAFGEASKSASDYFVTSKSSDSSDVTLNVKSDSSTDSHITSKVDGLTDTREVASDANSNVSSTNTLNVTSKDGGDYSNMPATSITSEPILDRDDNLNVAAIKTPIVTSKLEGEISDVTSKVRGDLLDLSSKVRDDLSSVITSKIGGDISDITSKIGGDISHITSKIGGDVSDITGSDVSDVTSKITGDITSKVVAPRDLFEDDSLFTSDRAAVAISKDGSNPPATRQLFDDDMLFGNEGRLSETSRDLFGDTEDFLFNKDTFNNRKPQTASTKARNRSAGSKKHVANVASNITSNVASNITSNVASNITSNVASNFADNVASDITSNVASNFASNVASNIAGNVAKSLNKGKQARSSSLFDDDEDSFDIFGRKPSTAKVSTAKTKDVVLFEDNDDDLFAAKPAERKPSSKSLFAEEKPQFKPARKSVGKKGSLFDDVSEDEDIFCSGTRTVTKVNVQDKKSKAKSLVRKAEEREVTYDPLDALSGNS